MGISECAWYISVVVLLVQLSTIKTRECRASDSKCKGPHLRAHAVLAYVGSTFKSTYFEWSRWGMLRAKVAMCPPGGGRRHNKCDLTEC